MSFNPQDYTILIVDDNPTNLAMLSEYLKRYGFVIAVAKSGESVLKRMSYFQPDIILLDVLMPGIDGFETCRRLKMNDLTKEIPVIFMTALASPEDKVKGFQVGAVDYVTKPLHQEEVLARVTTHLNIRALTRNLQQQNGQLQKRTNQLETISKVGRQIISILNLEKLIGTVVKLIQSEFGYYFVGVWLLTEPQSTGHGGTVALYAGSKQDSQQLHHVLSLDTPQSIVVSVCQTRQYYLANEVSVDVNYFAWKDLPQTRSELALPLQIGNKIIGVLDIQSNQPTAFDHEDVTALQTMADEIAISIGNAQSYRLAQQEIAERQRAETALQKANDELAKMNVNKDKFFSIVAHDLKGPFQPLLGMSELLPQIITTSSEEDIIEMCDSIHRTAKNVYNLLENLLQWSRLQQNRIQHQPSEINLNQMVEQNIQLLEAKATEKEITLQNKGKEELRVYADENMLDTVFRNLINNALKFTPPGGQVTISAEIREQGLGVKGWRLTPSLQPLAPDFVAVTVSDTGIGISTADLSKLFKIGSHHTTLGTAREKGTGLGLLICKEMVEKNWGQIGVKSELDKGTKVTFTVPLALPKEYRQDLGKTSEVLETSEV